jgi:hypothetical protein
MWFAGSYRYQLLKFNGENKKTIKFIRTLETRNELKVNSKKIQGMSLGWGSYGVDHEKTRGRKSSF